MSNVAKTLALSASTVEDYMRCPHYYWMKHVRRISEPTGHAQTVGTIWHNALDTYYTTRDPEQAKQILTSQWTGDVTEDTVRTLVRVTKALDEYCKRYANDGIETVRPADIDYREVALPNSPYKIRLKLDRLIKWDRCYWVMEHKMTTRLDRNKYNPNYQVSFYTWAARRLGFDVKVLGVIMDISHVLTTKIDFYRDDITKTEHNDAETERLAKSIGDRILADAANGYYPQNWSACSIYGECYYRRACKMSPDIRERIIEMDYPAPRPEEERPNGETV